MLIRHSQDENNRHWRLDSPLEQEVLLEASDEDPAQNLSDSPETVRYSDLIDWVAILSVFVLGIALRLSNLDVDSPWVVWCAAAGAILAWAAGRYQEYRLFRKRQRQEAFLKEVLLLIQEQFANLAKSVGDEDLRERTKRLASRFEKICDGKMPKSTNPDVWLRAVGEAVLGPAATAKDIRDWYANFAIEVRQRVALRLQHPSVE